jgi:hypothetical protein
VRVLDVEVVAVLFDLFGRDFPRQLTGFAGFVSTDLVWLAPPFLLSIELGRNARARDTRSAGCLGYRTGVIGQPMIRFAFA